MSNKALQLSVKDLVDFSARRGDLFSDAGGPTHQEGLAVHKRVQAARDASWKKEYALKQTLAVQGYSVTLQGRADLLNPSGPVIIVEELKSTYLPMAQMAANKLELFWAQVQVYAYLHAQETGNLHAYELRLSLADVHSSRIETASRAASCNELERFTFNLLQDYLEWYKLITRRRLQAQQSAQALAFPHPLYRAGQYTLAATLYRAVQATHHLLIEAPTGTGKTLSTLFPAAKALGEALIQQVVFLSAKTSGQRQAQTTMEALQAAGLQADYLTLSAREKLCPCRNSEAEGLLDEQGVCRYTRGFYDRLPAARAACLKVFALSPEALACVSQRFQLCPFALSQHLVPWSTVVIGDYNYYYHPMIRLSHFAGGGAWLLLVDEAHNLPARARDMYSGRLSTTDLDHFARQQLSHDAEGKRLLGKFKKRLLQWAGEQAPVTTQLPPRLSALTNELAERLQLPAERRAEVLFEAEAADGQAERRPFYQFLTALQNFGATHRALWQSAGEGKHRHAQLSLFCMDAAAFLAEANQRARATVAFSATLSPGAFYQQILGLQHASYLKVESPFPATNQLTLRVDYIDTRWQQRQASVVELRELLVQIYRQKPGKYLAFFPSYEYLQLAYDGFTSAFADVNTLQQAAKNTTEVQKAFLAAFFESDQPVLGFAILGGVFAEGVDFRGEALHGAIIIGTGMPQPSVQQKLIGDYYAKHGFDGQRYAFQYPGLTRVQQSAGRVIRSETDRGLVVLVDPRFKRHDYAALLAARWQVLGCADKAALREAIADFWQEPDGEVLAD